MIDPLNLSIDQIGRDVTAEAVMKATYDRIEEVNPKINAIVRHLPREEAMELARLADQRPERLPLHGIPVTVKDGIKVKGMECSQGCIGSYIRRANEDAVVVERLRNAGAIVIGQTNIPELTAAFETDNLLYGRTNNPFDLERMAGGSSGGEAAAVATGCSLLGIGSDGGGSIRIPAHCCGVVGFKPTHGRIPTIGRVPYDTQGLLAQIFSFGILARSVDACAVAFSAIAGPHPSDPYALPVPMNWKVSTLHGMRVGYYVDDGIASPTAETRAAVESAAARLRKSGARVKEVAFDCLSNSYDLLWDAFFGPLTELMPEALELMGVEKIHPLLESFIANGIPRARSGRELANVHGLVDNFRREMADHMRSFDLLLSPVMGTPAKPHGATMSEDRDCSYSAPYNLTGWPAMAVRCATSQDRLPIGVQLIAKPWREEALFAAGRAIEKG